MKKRRPLPLALTQITNKASLLFPIDLRHIMPAYIHLLSLTRNVVESNKIGRTNDDKRTKWTTGEHADLRNWEQKTGVRMLYRPKEPSLIVIRCPMESETLSEATACWAFEWTMEANGWHEASDIYIDRMANVVSTLKRAPCSDSDRRRTMEKRNAEATQPSMLKWKERNVRLPASSKWAKDNYESIYI